MIRAVLFDIDGTLLDTFEFIYRAFEHSLKTFGLREVERNEIAGLMGRRIEECYTSFGGGENVDKLVETHRSFQADNIELAKLFESSIFVLQTLKDAGIKIAAVTSRSVRTSVRTLDAVGITGLFDVILSMEDVFNLKPHPEPILKALDLLGIEKSEALMVGDTEADIEAGKAAGVRTVGALYGFGGEAIQKFGADYYISDIAELLGIITLPNGKPA